MINAEKAIFRTTNRVFRYGDGLFETIRVFEGNIPFLSDHFARLNKGMKFLKFKIPENFTFSFFKNEINKLTKEEGNWRIRLTVFRSNGGFYTPTNNTSRFVIEARSLESEKFQLNEKGKIMGIFDQFKLSSNELANLKTCNGIPYILASIYAKENKFDDCFLINERESIAEATSSNVFILKKDKILTPSLSSACIEGVMRNAVIKLASNLQFKVEEREITKDDLKEADEIWLTNSIQGIQYVSEFEGVHFENNIAKKFVKHFNQKILPD